MFAFTELSVAALPEELNPEIKPLITGQSLGFSPNMAAGCYAVRLCIASIQAEVGSGGRFLYVVEILTADGEWEWLDAWQPVAFGDRDPRCAYIVGTDRLNRLDFSEPGKFTFRPLVIRFDGVRWRGPKRVLSIDEVGGRVQDNPP